MTKTRSSSYINESLSLFKTTTDHHAHSLQEINLNADTQQLNGNTKKLNANAQQLNAISFALQKLIEAEEQRQQEVMSPRSSSQSLVSQFVSLPLSNLSKSVRLDFPRFKRDDPASWIYKADQYFSFYQTPFNERLLMPSFHMDGDALVWFQDSDENGMFATWEGFSEALLTRFGNTAYDDPMESLIRLRQTTNVVVYKGKFEALSNRIKGLSDSHKLSCFLSDLKDEVTREDAQSQEP